MLIVTQRIAPLGGRGLELKKVIGTIVSNELEPLLSATNALGEHSQRSWLWDPRAVSLSRR